jgi:SAM-dependent methyltransferase
MSIKDIFTEIYRQNTWGSEETRSGPASSLERTAEIREHLPQLFQQLQIQSLLDCGCGDWNWMKTVNLSGIQYMGVDIVEQLVTTLQKQFTDDSVFFQQLDCTVDPPETADLWLARDFCSVLNFQQILHFFQKFLESKSKYIALTSIDTPKQNVDSIPGNSRPLNMRSSPFHLPEPIVTLSDGLQWFSRKKCLVYSRPQVLEWYATTASKIAVQQPSKVNDKPDRNAHLVSNVRLRDVRLDGHMGLGKQSLG